MPLVTCYSAITETKMLIQYPTAHSTIEINEFVRVGIP